MKKDEIIRIIENLPTEIDGYKLCIYEIRNLEPWGLICMKGKLNNRNLLNIFDKDDNIRRYNSDDKSEYQFAVEYKKNEQLLFGKTNFDSLANGLETALKKIADY